MDDLDTKFSEELEVCKDIYRTHGKEAAMKWLQKKNNFPENILAEFMENLEKEMFNEDDEGISLTSC